MPKIISLLPVSSIKAGPDSTILPDGTIKNPQPYHAADVEFSDGVTVQVERPLTKAGVKKAYLAALAEKTQDIDGVKVGDDPIAALGELR